MNKANRYSPEVRERAVRMVFEHGQEYSSQWSAMCSIASRQFKEQLAAMRGHAAPTGKRAKPKKLA
jgi:hypothetical protein